MKDKVFIIWSGGNETANRVKHILEKQYNYVCHIGGNSDNSSTFASVGDTVIQQMKTCNQAIVLFQNRADGAVSNNLFFELGYVSANYGMKKVHCVKRETDQIILPSDFDNAFVEALPASTEDEYIDAIIHYFIERQKLSVDENKMQLVNNRYLIHDMIKAHYSESGSRCSDYELAQYVLFYMQAADLFQDEIPILAELQEFKAKHYSEFSSELMQAVNLSIAFLEVHKDLRIEDDIVFITDEAFRKYYNVCNDMLTEIIDDDSGTFDEWANVFLAVDLAYITSLYAANPNLTETRKQYLYKKVVDYATKGNEYIDRLMEVAPIAENNDDTGLVMVFKAYNTRHLFNGYNGLGLHDEAQEWLLASMKARKQLVRTFANNSIDTKLYDNFKMEYFLNLMEYLDFSDRESIDEFEYMMYLDEIDEYINEYSQSDTMGTYFKKIVNHRQRLE